MKYSYQINLEAPCDDDRAQHEYDSFPMALHLHYCDKPIRASSSPAGQGSVGVIVTLDTTASESEADVSLFSLLQRLNEALNISLVARKLVK